MSQDLRTAFLCTLAVVMDLVGPVALVSDVPPVLAEPLLVEVESATGQRVQMVWGEGLRSEQKRSSLGGACRIHDMRNRRSVK